jgi:hypothetical protein
MTVAFFQLFKNEDKMAYMKNIDILLREKYTDESKISEMNNWISMFLKGDISFYELPFGVKLFLCKLEVDKNCEELNQNASAQIIIAKRSDFIKFIVYLKKKIQEINSWWEEYEDMIKLFIGGLIFGFVYMLILRFLIQ